LTSPHWLFYCCAMLSEAQNQFSLARMALSTRGAQHAVSYQFLAIEGRAKATAREIAEQLKTKLGRQGWILP